MKHFDEIESSIDYLFSFNNPRGPLQDVCTVPYTGTQKTVWMTESTILIVYYHIIIVATDTYDDSPC